MATDHNQSSLMHQNKAPVILVHGFCGWGKKEMGGVYSYWGGFSNLENEIYKATDGHPIYTAAVGPFSSVWDRAIELFWQIKGGRVDYGEKHAAEHKHERFGRTYPGLYPEWDDNHPVHLIGHSMGGLTARALVQMLGDKGCSKGENHLFGQNDRLSSSWVLSITTVSTPHDGTPLTLLLEDILPLILNAASAAVLAAGVKSVKDPLFDFKLDQWGIQPQQADESFYEYRQRISTSQLWKELKAMRDFSHYDLSLAGAAELNSWVLDAPDVFYLSYSTCNSYSGMPWTEAHLPKLSTQPFFFASATALGSIAPRPAHHSNPPLDKSWRPNDGVVSTRSMPYPSHCLSPPQPPHAAASHPITPTDSLTAHHPSPTHSPAAAGGGAESSADGGVSMVRKCVARETAVRDWSDGAPAATTGWKGLPRRLVEAAGRMRPGEWNYLGVCEVDHLGVVGWTWLWDAAAFYRDHVALLSGLPSRPPAAN